MTRRPMAPIPEGLLAAPLHAQDLVAAHGLTQMFAWPHRYDDWRQMLTLGSGIAIHGPGRDLVGTGLIWPWGGRAATLGLILVREEYQKRGLGRMIVDRLMIMGDGQALRLHATEAGLGLYQLTGFKRTGLVHQWQGRYEQRRTIAKPRDLRLLRPADKEQVTALDRAAFGAPRVRLVDALIACGQGFVIERSGVISAFGFRRQFGRGNLIGPIVTSATDDAEALVEALLVDGFNRIDILETATSLTTLLAAAGLEHIDTVVAMTANGWPALQSPTRTIALASQAFG